MFGLYMHMRRPLGPRTSSLVSMSKRLARVCWEQTAADWEKQVPTPRLYPHVGFFSEMASFVPSMAKTCEAQVADE